MLVLKNLFMRRSRGGFALATVIMILLLLMIIVPLMVMWVQNDTKISMKNQRGTTAFNLAEAAVDRGYWKIKSSTITWNQALSGQPLAGYEFDATYTDVSGGSYRIDVSSSGVNQVTVVGEGRDNSTSEVRAIRAVFLNQTVYSPLISNGNFTSSKVLCAFWGPIMAQGDFNMTDDVAAKRYFPRKFAKGVVTGHGSNLRDVNGLNPPNTDNVEWWSDYQYVPELPVLDFDALRSSAAATGTLNRYNNKTDYNGSPCKTNTIVIGTTTYSICKAFPAQPLDDSGPSQVWYWDGDLTIEGFDGGGSCGYANSNYGFKGTLIVRGSLTIRGAGCYHFSGPVPAQAYLDHYKLLQNTYDTSAPGEYPADIGYQVNKTTFNFGTEYFQPYPGAGNGYLNTVGERGFTYVGGDLNVIGPSGYMDFVGAVWVVGNVNGSGGSANAFCGVFFNDQLSLPTLNVVLVRKSWQEISPNPQAWP
jgi:type II secretory pathway pseudopilin PulG